MEKLSNLCDEELVLLIQSGDDELKTTCINIMFKRYEAFIKNLARKAYYENFHVGISIDDVESIIYVSLFNAFYKFATKKGEFRLYWLKISKRQLTRFFNKERQYYINSHLSFDQTIREDDDTIYGEIIGSNDEKILSSGEVMLLSDISRECLSSDEKDVFILRAFHGATNKEVMEELSLSKHKAQKLYLLARKKLVDLYMQKM